MATACEAVARWIARSGITPGTPLFRAVSKGDRVLPDRLGDDGVALIVKGRIVERELAKGASRTEAEAVAKGYAGHSLRAGFVSSAADAKVAVYDIQKQSRHRSAEMVNIYIREADAWTDNPLRKVGF